MSPGLMWFMGIPTVGGSTGHRWNIPLELSWKLWKMVGVAGMATRHPPLVGGIDCHTRCRGCLEMGSKDPGLLWGTVCQMEALEGQPFTTPPALKCIWKCEFLPDGLPCQDMRMKPHQMTLANAWVLQYWAEKVNPPVSGDPCPLARCVRELGSKVEGTPPVMSRKYWME